MPAATHSLIFFPQFQSRSVSFHPSTSIDLLFVSLPNKQTESRASLPAGHHSSFCVATFPTFLCVIQQRTYTYSAHQENVGFDAFLFRDANERDRESTSTVGRFSSIFPLPLSLSLINIRVFFVCFPPQSCSALVPCWMSTILSGPLIASRPVALSWCTMIPHRWCHGASTALHI